MKKTYINPSLLIVELKGSNICDSFLIGSVGNGEDYVKQEFIDDDASSGSNTQSYNVWDDDWRK